MIYRFIFALCIAQASTSAMAQDTIAMRDGGRYIASIQEISSTQIKFLRSDMPTGPIYHYERCEVDHISFAGGQKEYFKPCAQPATSAASPTPTGMMPPDPIWIANDVNGLGVEVMYTPAPNARLFRDSRGLWLDGARASGKQVSAFLQTEDPDAHRAFERGRRQLTGGIITSVVSFGMVMTVAATYGGIEENEEMSSPSREMLAVGLAGCLTGAILTGTGMGNKINGVLRYNTNLKRKNQGLPPQQNQPGIWGIGATQNGVGLVMTF